MTEFCCACGLPLAPKQEICVCGSGHVRRDKRKRKHGPNGKVRQKTYGRDESPIGRILSVTVPNAGTVTLQQSRIGAMLDGATVQMPGLRAGRYHVVDVQGTVIYHGKERKSAMKAVRFGRAFLRHGVTEERRERRFLAWQMRKMACTTVMAGLLPRI